MSVDEGSSKRTDDVKGLEALFGDEGSSKRTDENMASNEEESSTISYVGGFLFIIFIFAMMWSMLRIFFNQFSFDIYSVGGALLIIPALICFKIGGGMPEVEHRKI